ncbi:hypothetical protein Patl1_01389 [Pistacia atlantica]|uniref:Uncharacterized protein n=1 Tax=Pistacia atlantica TaxID=434234 RepID=A0ACC1C3M9_9ROSI|nr:hypothetical protein Patl1_01389 [Pistacia atlantica]
MKKEADEIRKLVHDVAELTGKFNLQDFIWFCKNLDLQGFGKRLKDNDESSEMKLTRENIKSFILYEETLIYVVHCIYLLFSRAVELPGKSRLVEESDIVNLPYLQAIVKETLRLHPTGPMIVRESTENCTINGYDIPARTRLFVNTWAIGRDPNHWENPLEFRPERFVVEDGKSQLDVRGQHFHLLPFGSGRRSCPGTSLALNMVQATLSAMIQCFDWKLSGGGVTADMEEGPGLTLPRAHPLICVPVTRLNPLPLL